MRILSLEAKAKRLEYTRKWRKRNKHKTKEYDHTRRIVNREKYRAERKQANLECKLEVLTHYGKDGRLQCCWPDCEVIDPDMLTADHIENDGAKHRKKEGSGSALYAWLRRNGYPKGFQTLCGNHQWKKELMRRREQ